MSRIFRHLSFYRLLISLAGLLIRLGHLEYRLFVRLGIFTWSCFKLLLLPFFLCARLFHSIINLRSSYDSLQERRLLKKAIKLKQARTAKSQRSDERQHYFSLLKSEPRKFLFKPALAFAILALLIVMPLKFYDTVRFFQRLESKITHFAQAAVGQINQGKQAALASDFQSAGNNFSQASADFVSAGEELSGVDGLLFQLLKVVPNEKLQLAASGQKLVLAGQLGTGLAADLSEAASALLGDHADKNLSQVLTAFSVPGERALIKLEQLTPVLAQIDASDLPANYQAPFQALQDKSTLMATSLKELLQVTEQLQIFLGRDIDKRYLLVFQNNTEARATGGFMGSFAIIDFKQGQIKKVQSPGGGTYDTEGGLRRLVQAPKPLWIVNPLWHLWDCNWWPDWSKSAQKIMWFYEKSDGSTVDGVISLTPTVIVKLLEVIGPIDLTVSHGVVINSTNFLDTVQAIAEQKPDVTNTPKQIIGDLLDAIMDKLSTKLEHDDYLQIVKLLESSLNEKDILLYLTDPSLQAKVSDMGWDGRLKSTTGDYLSVINTNISGGKSDKKIVQSITHEAKVSSDGSIFDTVTIVRDHQGIKGDGFSGVRNLDWLRVYVPLGSRLVSATGFWPLQAKLETPDPAWEIDPDLLNENNAEVDPISGVSTYREQDKTVFAHWAMVDPGELTVIKLVYKLPFKALSLGNDRGQDIYKYTLLVQKQAGATNSEVSSNLILPQGLTTAWHYPEASVDSFYDQDLDRFWAYLISSK